MLKIPNFAGNACAGLSDEEREELWWAAKTLADEPGIIVRFATVIGSGVDWVRGKAAEVGSKIFGDGWRTKVTETTEEVLWKAYDIATLGLGPQGEHEPWRWFNKAVTAVTGTVTGFIGVPGAAIDIPITTLLIMRSIAEIARSKGEDLASDETKRACLQVFAFGGPNIDEDAPETSYWSTRMALSHGTIEALIKQVATRFGIALSEKFMAQAVPIAGALTGGTLNYVFMDYYQQMARVHFILRHLERKHGDDSAVRPCFDNLVRQARARKKM